MIRRYLLLFCSLSIFAMANSQKLSFNRSTLVVKEPYEKDVRDKEQEFEIELKVDKLPSTAVKVTVETSKESTYKSDRFTLITKEIDSLKEKSIIKLKVKDDAYSDVDGNIILKLSYKDGAGESQMLQDTVLVKNTHPFKNNEPKEYTDWNDGKRAEIFIGTNFDFNSKNNVTDWYGGVSVFLPGITDFKFSESKSNKVVRWGINGGLYHSKSFSNFGNVTPENFDGIYSKVRRLYSDTINGVPVPMAEVQYDTMTAKPRSEINNWGAYGGLMYQIARTEKDNFVTNVFIGSHFEVIRRNVQLTYDFDTSGTAVKNVLYSSIRSLRQPPKPTRNVYYDGYFGVNMPFQFLWKDVLDLKLIPCFGFGPANYVRGEKNVPWFYLIQFDLLAKLGGVRLNLGGEVRGYFPQNPPIFTAYLGGSFSVTKLVDFLTK